MPDITPSGNDDAPIDPDEFWGRMNRRLADLKANWRACRVRRCRRARRCADADVACMAARTPRVLTEAEDAQARASLRRALTAEMARRGIAK